MGVAKGSGAHGERVSAGRGGGSPKLEVRGLPGGNGGRRVAGLYSLWRSEIPEVTWRLVRRDARRSLQWGGGGPKQLTGDYLRGDAPRAPGGVK